MHRECNKAYRQNPKYLLIALVTHAAFENNINRKIVSNQSGNKR